MNSIFNLKNGFALVAVALLLLAGCTFYDNYDINLMPNATANNGDDDGNSSSSKKSGSDTLVIIVGQSSDSKSSSSGVPTWTCGDSVMVRGGVEYETVEIGGVCITKKNLNYKPTGTFMPLQITVLPDHSISLTLSENASASFSEITPCFASICE